MKRALLAAVLFAIGAGAASAGTMDVLYANTLSSQQADGSVTRWAFNADGTYHMTGANNVTGTGTFTSDAAHFCVTPSGGAPACVEPFAADKNVGDSWVVHDKDGKPSTVTIVAGR